MFRRSPAIAAFCVLILGLGIGAVVSIFGVVNALLIQPLPYPHGDRIVRVGRNVSGPDWQDWHDQSKSFDALATFRGGEVAITVNGRGMFHEVYQVSSEFLDVFEVAPQMGRAMDRNSILVSHTFWKQHGSTLGQSVKINQQIYTIAGVMPQGFHFPNKASVWMQETTLHSSQNRTAHNFRAIGRLKVPLALAQSEIPVPIVPLQQQAAAPYRETLTMLFGAAVLLLLIACANVSSLVLARAQARQREFAVRASLGASSSRIISQVVLESLALGLTSAAAGLLFASWALSAAAAVIPASIDWRVAAFAVAIATLSSLLFSLYPAWRVSRLDLTGALRTAGQKGMVGGGSGWFRRSLAAGQVALSLVMLCGSLMLLREMSRLLEVDMGMDPANVLVSYTHVPADKLEDHINATRTFSEILSELRSTPGVESAAAIMGMPTGKYNSNGGYMFPGKPLPKDLNQLPQAGFRVNSPGLFATLRIPIKKGRDFTEDDSYEKPFVAIINETLARRSFPNVDPIGQQILCGLDSPKPMTIVGVVGDVRHAGPASENNAELYMPYHQHPYFANELQIAVRAKGDPKPLSALVRAIANRRNPDVAVNSVTLESMLEDSISTPRFRSQLLLAMAVLALVLASAGLYGVLAYLVSQRLSEFGLRVALGARPHDVVRLVGREAALILGTGFTAGIAIIYLMGTRDLISIGAAVAVLLTAGLAACILPGWGAAKADPLTVLRSE
jgi:putative ABC transport system permease protein